MAIKKRGFREFEDGDWRITDSLQSRIVYTKKFALFPIRTESNERIWLKNYYQRQAFWYCNFSGIDLGESHPDRPTKISEADLIFRKLAEPH